MSGSQHGQEAVLFRSGAWVCSLSSEGHILDANPTMAEGLGQGVDALQGSAFSTYVATGKEAVLQEHLGALQAGTAPGPLTLQMGDSLDRAFWIAWEAAPTEAGSAWVGHDVTTLHQELSTLRASEARLRRFVEHSPDTFLVHDMEGRIVDANLAACDNLGYTHEELLEAHIPDVEMSVKPGSLKGIWNRMTPGNAVLIEGCHRRKDGTTFPVEVRLGLFGSPGNLLLHALCHDITARKRGERNLALLNEELREARDEALAANHAKSAFLASMSHELRTPLNAITGYAELLEEELEDAGLAELCPDTQRIQKASAHLLYLINEILDLSKIEAGRIVLEWRAFAVREVLESVLQVVRPLCERSGNQLVCEVAPEVGKMTSDASRVRQVLMNLLSNANKFTHEGKVTLRVSLEEREGGRQSRLRFAVEDTGIGIAPDALARIFEPFVQADGSNSKRYDGTGLGLTISRRLCHLLGGELHAESEVGEGSTFAFSLPRRPISTEESPLPATPREVRPMRENVEVLLVAENEALHEAFSQALLREGVKMRSAMDGARGLADVKAYQPRCVLLHMPSSEAMSDFDAWGWLDLCHADPNIARIPVVLLASQQLTEEERILLGSQVTRIHDAPHERTDEIAKIVAQVL